jgi:hypothetical protein
VPELPFAEQLNAPCYIHAYMTRRTTSRSRAICSWTVDSSLISISFTNQPKDKCTRRYKERSLLTR